MDDRATELVAAERCKQIEKGYTAEKDDRHRDGRLRLAASLVVASTIDDVQAATVRQDSPVTLFSAQIHFKYKNDTIHKLVIAAAMLCAEIDRLLRAQDRGAALNIPDNEISQ